MRHFQHFILGLAFAGFLISGCADPKKDAKTPVGGDDAHHDHHDEHKHGPKGGEVFDVAGAVTYSEAVHYRINVHNLLINMRQWHIRQINVLIGKIIP